MSVRTIALFVGICFGNVSYSMNMMNTMRAIPATRMRQPYLNSSLRSMYSWHNLQASSNNSYPYGLYSVPCVSLQKPHEFVELNSFYAVIPLVTIAKKIVLAEIPVNTNILFKVLEDHQRRMDMNINWQATKESILNSAPKLTKQDLLFCLLHFCQSKLMDLEKPSTCSSKKAVIHDPISSWDHKLAKISPGGLHGASEINMHSKMQMFDTIYALNSLARELEGLGICGSWDETSDHDQEPC